MKGKKEEKEKEQVRGIPAIAKQNPAHGPPGGGQRLARSNTSTIEAERSLPLASNGEYSLNRQ